LVIALVGALVLLGTAVAPDLSRLWQSPRTLRVGQVLILLATLAALPTFLQAIADILTA
jgi:hypothetical protein